MSPRVHCLLALTLLAACSSKAPAPVSPASRAPQPAAQLPANMRELSGMLTSTDGYLPAGADVELALLLVNQRAQPQRALASLDLQANGGALPFSLRFAPEAFPADARIELHVRATQNGQLAWRLRPLPIAVGQSQALGELRLAPAP